MTAENRSNSFWERNDNSPDYLDQPQSESPRQYFNEVVRSLKAHAQYLQEKGLNPQVISVAVHEYVLKYANACKVTRSVAAPYVVSISYDKYEAVVYRQPNKNILADLNNTRDAVVVHGMIMLMQLEEYVQKASEASSKVKEIFVSKEEKCFERARKFANTAARTHSFEELLEGIKKQVAADCAEAKVEADKLNDIYVTLGDQKVRVFVNDTYPYKAELFTNNNTAKVEEETKTFDPNMLWD